MDYSLIIDKIYDVYAECEVHTFPIDCFDILRHYGFRLYTYSQIQQVNARLHEMCRKYSDDAFRYNDIICYNQKAIECRIRFSLMHEFGHYILGHEESSPENEDEADYFASCILAPRIAISKTCRTADDIHDKFGLSYAASNRALADFRRWYPMGRSETEKKLEELLFHNAPKISTSNIDECEEGEKITLSGAPMQKYKTRHAKKWKEIEERNKFIKENICDLNEYAFRQLDQRIN